MRTSLSALALLSLVTACRAPEGQTDPNRPSVTAAEPVAVTLAAGGIT